jgi:pilus assembly protein CpaE
MSAPRTVSFRIASEKVAELDLLAKVMDRDRSYLLNQAVNNYLREQLWVAANAGQGLGEYRKRELHDGEERRAMASPWIGKKGVEREETAYSARADAEPLMRERLTGTWGSSTLSSAPAVLDEPPPPPHSASYKTYPIAAHAMDEAPITSAALPAAVRLPDPADGRLLVFLSAKGGSGVTTLACCFAVTLAQESKRKTLLIDLNLPLGDAAINLGVNANYSTVHALHNAHRLDANFLLNLLEKHSSGLYVLAAPSELVPSQASDEAIERLLKVARKEFDYVVLDAGSSMDPQHINLFDEFTTVYLVTQVGIPELRNSNRLITRFPVKGGPHLEIVINRYLPRAMEIDEPHITKALTRPARWRVPNDYAAVRRMQNTAAPLNHTPISRVIQQMARYVCGRPVAEDKKKGNGFFGWKVYHN